MTYPPFRVEWPPIVAPVTPDPRPTLSPLEKTRTVLGCDDCEVTWRDQPGAPCWFCGKAGHVVRPERLVLD